MKTFIKKGKRKDFYIAHLILLLSRNDLPFVDLCSVIIWVFLAFEKVIIMISFCLTGSMHKRMVY